MQTEAIERNLGGRPPKPEGQRLGVVSLRLSPAMLEQIDAIVDARIDGSDRSSVIREILADGLAAMKGKRS